MVTGNKGRRVISYLNQYIQRVNEVIHSAPVSNVEKVRLKHFTVFLFLGLPTMLVYGMHSVLQMQYVLLLFVTLSAITLTVSWFVLITFNIGSIVYRINTALFAGLILYLLLIGGEGGSKILWMYIFPLISFFLFGKKEGMFWTTLILFIALVILWNPLEMTSVYRYSNEFIARFVTTFLIVTAITYWFEHFRSYYRDDLEQKNLELKREIAERRKAEEKLRASEAKFRSWLEYSPVCTKILDCDCRLRYMSSAGVKHLKVADISVFYGEVFPLDCYPEPERTLITETLQRIQETGEIIELETPVFDTTGKLLWFLSTFMPIADAHGECDYLMVVSADITDRKKAQAEQLSLEKQLQQSQKMEAIGTLSGGIAHDFNNILAAILGYAELAQEYVAGDLQAEEDIENIIISSKRGVDLVKGLLTYSRKTDLQESCCAPEQIVNEALKMLKVTLPASITIEDDIHADCGMVFINGTHLHQIVINLCTNGIQSMLDEKGVLRLTLSRCEVSDAELPPDRDLQAGSFVAFTVADTGTGMDAGTIERIFDPYFTTKGLGAGTGLGLAVVQGIVQQCNGFIEVDSNVDKGTTVRVFLPVTEVSESAIASSQKHVEMKDKGHNETLLIVDDELLVLRFYEKILSRSGYTTVCFSDSSTALEAFRREPEKFDLLITDQTMPGLTGADLTRAVLDIKPTMPIMLCTGHSETVSMEKALTMGVKKYIYKPLGVATLLDAVHELLSEEGC